MSEYGSWESVVAARESTDAAIRAYEEKYGRYGARREPAAKPTYEHKQMNWDRFAATALLAMILSPIAIMSIWLLTMVFSR